MKSASTKALRGAGLLVLLSIHCGGGDEAASEEAPARTETTAGREAPPADDGVQISGLMGTISREAVQRSMQPRMDSFLRCFVRRYDEVDVLGGHIALSFRVKVDGSVLWVYPRQSTIGDRATERCLLEIAERIRFSRPQGGEAEFEYPLDLDPPEDVRPPLAWESTQVREVVEEQRSRVDCGRGGFTVTAYVAPGGAVLAAGAATESPEQVSQLDCVAEAVASWEMPDPGSYPAKVSFSL